MTKKIFNTSILLDTHIWIWLMNGEKIMEDSTLITPDKKIVKYSKNGSVKVFENKKRR